MGIISYYTLVEDVFFYVIILHDDESYDEIFKIVGRHLEDNNELGDYYNLITTFASDDLIEINRITTLISEIIVKIYLTDEHDNSMYVYLLHTINLYKYDG